jgi:CysZ protein
MAELPSGVRGFFSGLTYPFRGVSWLLKHRSVWPWAVVPLLVGGLSLVVFLSGAMLFLDDLYVRLLPEWAASGLDVAWWKDIGHGLTRFFVGLGSFLLCAAGGLLGALGSIAVLGGPFNEFLSEAVEKEATGQDIGEPLHWKQVIVDVSRGALGALGRLTLWLAIYVPLAMLSLIPGVGVVFAAGTIVYSAFFLAINFTDPVLDRKRLRLAEKVGYARQHIATHLGFGAGIFVLLLIPFAALIVTPGLVTGGTLLFLERGGLDEELAATAAKRRVVGSPSPTTSESTEPTDEPGQA